MDAIRLQSSQRSAAVKLYARSFFNYPLMIIHWPDPKRRERYLEWFLGCTVNYASRYGEIYTTPDVAGIVLWLPPGQTTLSTWRFIRSGLLPAIRAEGVRHYFTQVVKNEALIQKAHAEIMHGPHWYLWVLAVDPDQQGRGIGSILMKPGLQQADAQNLPCYLETHDSNNVPFYEKRGFVLARTEHVPGTDVRFWCMRREPRQEPAGQLIPQ